MLNLLKNKHILLGITGSIAAYRMPDLIRQLQAKGAKVKVIMTKGAQAFITPLTFSALTGHPVYTDVFHFYSEHPIIHLDLARWADIFVIAPASADVIAKLAQGMANDLLTSTALGCSRPILVCPSMNPNMYFKPAVQANLRRLTQNGFYVMQPAKGKLACGTEGQGRLPAIEDIIARIEMFFFPQDLRRYKILVTAGPTQEAIDPVRFITNRSSGKMGFAIAKLAAARGAEVILVSGPTQLRPPYGVNFISITTTQEMKEAVFECYPEVDAVIMAAAVADFRPRYTPQKIKKADGLALYLEKTEDILSLLGQYKRHQLLVGFAAETGDPLAEAKRKLEQKRLDLIIANDVTQPGAGFGTETNQVTLIYRNGVRECWPLMYKEEVAMRLLDRIKGLLCRMC